MDITIGLSKPFVAGAQLMDDKYYILINSDQLGPYSAADLSGLLSDGVITRLTPLKSDDRDSWFTVGDVLPESPSQSSSLGSLPAHAPKPPAPPVVPKPTPSPESLMVHVSRDGQQFGPYKYSDLQGYLMTGELHPNDMAWHDGLSDWITLRSLTNGLQKPLAPGSHQSGYTPARLSSNSPGACGPLESRFRSVLTFCGVLCYVFAVIDFAGMFFGYDLTGVSWSPMVAGFLGAVLVNCSEANHSPS